MRMETRMGSSLRIVVAASEGVPLTVVHSCAPCAVARCDRACPRVQSEVAAARAASRLQCTPLDTTTREGVMHKHVEHKQNARKPPRKKKEPRDRRDTIPVAPRTDSDDKTQGEGQPADGEKRMEGEGSYTAGRRYDKAAQEFATSGEVEGSARQAADDLSDDELLDGGPTAEDDTDDTNRFPH